MINLKRAMFLLSVVLWMPSCAPEPETIFVSQEQYEEYLTEKYASEQMSYLPKEAKLIKTFSPVSGDSMIVFELDGKKYLYRKWIAGSHSTEIMCPYQEQNQNQN